MDLHGANIATHIATGSMALMTGLFALFSRKGARLHRRAGWTTAGFGGVALTTATIAVFAFNPPAPLVAATLSATYQYLSGLRTIALRDHGPGWADKALALAAFALIGGLVLQMGQGSHSWNPRIGYATMGFLGVVALYDLSRPLWIVTWRIHVRPLDHGLKMIGFYFAMMSAGFGNLLAAWQPLSQLLPSLLGLAFMIGFATYYSAKPLRRAPQPI
jgi:hypothetical protein